MKLFLKLEKLLMNFTAILIHGLRGGDTVVVRVLKQHENEHFYSDPLFIKAEHFRFYENEEFLVFKII